MKSTLATAMFAAAVCFFSAICPEFLAAQSDRGSVTGRITDNAGAVLPGTTVSLTNEQPASFKPRSPMIQVSTTSDS